MTRLKDFGVEEMNTFEMEELNGGSWFSRNIVGPLAAVGVAVGVTVTTPITVPVAIATAALGAAVVIIINS